jgi:hypothetical protein
VFTAACFALLFGFIHLMGNVSAIGWITRGVNALWRVL